MEGAQRGASERCAALHPRLADLMLADRAVPLNDEQLRAVRTLAADGQGVSVLQALAGTGKTRVLAALARIYEAGGHHVVGVAPTGRAARELGDAADIATFTIHRLLHELQDSGGLAPQTVILFDEAGVAPTRPAAELFAQAERAHAKVIAVGDSGQLPSVAAGGWFGAIADSIGGPQLHEVMRQRDPGERAALEDLRHGEPERYVEFKRTHGDVHVHDREDDALTEILANWTEARLRYGVSQAVMIARDNASRSMLNEHARALVKYEGALASDGVVIAGREFCVGDRVIARRNDRYRDIDNGTRGTVRGIDHRTGTLTVEPGAGGRRELDAEYVAEHLDYAYALAGHGAQGATVEWAGVLGRPSELTAEWAYTALSRARDQTQLHLIAESSAARRQREEYAPPEPSMAAREVVDAACLAMRRHEAEKLALEWIAAPELPEVDCHKARLPLAELPEAGAEWATTARPPPAALPAPGRRTRRSERDLER